MLARYSIKSDTLDYELVTESHYSAVIALQNTTDSKHVNSNTLACYIKMWYVNKCQFVDYFDDEPPEANNIQAMRMSENSKYSAYNPKPRSLFVNVWMTSRRNLLYEFEVDHDAEILCFSYESKYLIYSSSEDSF